jgi:hypothetical protein
MNSYEAALTDAGKQLEHLVNQRADIDGKIHSIRQLIMQLAAHAGVDPDGFLSPLTVYDNRGLTSGVKAALRESRKWRTVADLRQILQGFGYDLSGYANSSAVVNTVLHRLQAQGLVEKDTKEGTAKYRWKDKVEERIKKGWAQVTQRG